MTEVKDHLLGILDHRTLAYSESGNANQNVTMVALLLVGLIQMNRLFRSPRSDVQRELVIFSLVLVGMVLLWRDARQAQ